jgi:hypothetical protein
MGRESGTQGTGKKNITLVRKPEERSHLEDLGVNRKIILDWVSGK